jgi:hypothetical protein
VPITRTVRPQLSLCWSPEMEAAELPEIPSALPGNNEDRASRMCSCFHSGNAIMGSSKSIRNILFGFRYLTYHCSTCQSLYAERPGRCLQIVNGYIVNMAIKSKFIASSFLTSEKSCRDFCLHRLYMSCIRIFIKYNCY